jgi:acetaldehyde dehydrogenase (acetylating)
MILATGGSAMVKAAHSSGTPSLGVGPGNVPAFIERSADIEAAVDAIMLSKTFDNGTICASEQSIITEDAICGKVVSAFERRGGYFIPEADLARLENLIVKPGGGLNTKIVGKNARHIADLAGIGVPPGTRVLIGRQKNVGARFPLTMEKLSPILAFFSEADAEAACRRCLELISFGGLGHTLAIHSRNEQIIRAFCLQKPVSRIIINSGGVHGAIGATTGLYPSLTLGCGTVGGSASSDNITARNLFNVRRCARVLPAGQSRAGNAAAGGTSTDSVAASSVSAASTAGNEQLIADIVKKVLMESGLCKLNN